MARGNEDEWCAPCQEWRARGLSDKTKLACHHVAAGISEGAKHADAAKRYETAIANQTAHWGEEHFRG